MLASCDRPAVTAGAGPSSTACCWPGLDAAHDGNSAPSIIRDQGQYGPEHNTNYFMLPTEHPRDYSLASPLDLPLQKLSRVQEARSQLDFVEGSLQTMPPVPEEVLLPVLLESMNDKVIRAEAATQGNCTAACRVHAQHAAPGISPVTLVLGTCGAIGECVTLSVISSSSTYQVIKAAELNMGSTVHQVEVQAPAEPHNTHGHTSASNHIQQNSNSSLRMTSGSNKGVWVAVRCTTHIAVLYASQALPTDWSSWQLEWRGRLAPPLIACHIAWSPVLPELAMLLDNYSLHVISIAKLAGAPATLASRPEHLPHQPVWSPEVAQQVGGAATAGHPPQGLQQCRVHLRPHGHLTAGALEAGLRLACVYGSHPRVLLVAAGRCLWRVVLPSPHSSHATRPCVPLLVMQLAAGEAFCGLTAPPRSPTSLGGLSKAHEGEGASELMSLVVAATTLRILVVDLRRPSGPLVSAPNEVSPDLHPHLLALLPLHQPLKSTNRGEKGHLLGGAATPGADVGLLLLWSDGITGRVHSLELRLRPSGVHLVLTQSSNTSATSGSQGKTQLVVRRVGCDPGLGPGFGSGPGWVPVCWGHTQVLGAPQRVGLTSQPSWPEERKQLEFLHACTLTRSAGDGLKYSQALMSMESRYWGSQGTPHMRHAARMRYHLALAEGAPATQGLAVVEFPAPEALTQLCSHALLLQHSHAGDLLVQVLGRRAAAWQALRPGPSSEGVILQSGSSLVQGVNSRGEEGGAKPRTHVVGTASLALSQGPPGGGEDLQLKLVSRYQGRGHAARMILGLKLNSLSTTYLLQSHHAHLSDLLRKAEEQRLAGVPQQQQQQQQQPAWGSGSTSSGAEAHQWLPENSSHKQPTTLDIVAPHPSNQQGADDDDLGVRAARISLQSSNPLTLGDLLHRTQHQQDTVVGDYDPSTYLVAIGDRSHRAEKPLVFAGRRVATQLSTPPPNDVVSAEAVCSQAIAEAARMSSQSQGRWGTGAPLIARTCRLAVSALSPSMPTATHCAYILAPHATVLLRPEQLHPGVPFRVHTAGQPIQPHTRPLTVSATALACYQQLLGSWPLAGSSNASAYVAAPVQPGMARPQAAGPPGVPAQGPSHGYHVGATQQSQLQPPPGGPGPSRLASAPQPVAHPWSSQTGGF